MKKQENKYYYIRVSSLTQNEIRQYDLLGIDELEENLYIDKSSGSNTHRTALKHFLKDLERDIFIKKSPFYRDVTSFRLIIL